MSRKNEQPMNLLARPTGCSLCASGWVLMPIAPWAAVARGESASLKGPAIGLCSCALHQNAV
ncbi:hypothetical protein CLI92_10980 [Vandammella animalimorsus]|uniref:Uncharacterized protein n=1 Tax=Vandammella animalimorsus TaxID=2029117 RepID=A0A2A2A7R5_9BURK|nr:hypothetical protein CK620_11720 [Vandammella animalimorsus]PAT42076.1 hypothetical protein CK621_11015 [Vandammella animalimorsus]PAX16088.1 hypothetical protein CLI92_10980 [Vandammella animalimorsus]